ncbi:MAG: thioesterase domain-containing protein, partial [Alphaproteobacteria bacterium]
WAIPVNTKGEGAPVFYIASPEVNTIGYAQLSRELGSDISGYILQPPPTTEHIRTVRKEEVPAISARFIEEVRHIQPNGPYRLIGMCTGAHIAAEMARQMEEKSLQVSFIGVINTWSLYSISALYHFEKVVDFSRMLGYYRRRISNLKWSEVSNRFLPALKNKVAPSKSAQQPESTNAQNYQLVRQYDDTVVPVEVQKWAKERPADLIKIKHPVTVFRIASKPYWRINSYELGWDYLAEETKVISLKEPVHDAILRQPHIAHFAKQLREELLKK